MNLTITIDEATPAGFTATVLTDATGGLNRASLRTLILNMAAAEMGLSMKQMRDAGFDISYMTEGWDFDMRTVAGGRRRRTFKVRPQTAAEQDAILRTRGGFVDNGDGSMGFVLPQPRGRAIPVKVKRQK